MNKNDEIKKKSGVSSKLFINLFSRRFLNYISGRSPDSKAISRSPSHPYDQDSGQNDRSSFVQLRGQFRH